MFVHAQLVVQVRNISTFKSNPNLISFIWLTLEMSIGQAIDLDAHHKFQQEYIKLISVLFMLFNL